MLSSKSLLTLLVCILLAFPAQAVEPPVKYITDATGHDVPLFLNAARVVTLAPNVTEMVCYLGFAEHLIGCSDFCDYPEQTTAQLTRVGGFIDTSLEAIVALDPELVIAYQGNSMELVEQLRALDIEVLALNEAASLRDVAVQLHTISNVIGTETFENNTAADEFYDWLQGYPADIETAAARPSVFFGYPGEMSYTCGPGSFLNDLIRRTGCVNVVGDIDERWPMVGAEFIIAANPDVILTATDCIAAQDPQAVRAEMLATLQADPVWSALDAVREDRIIVIDSDILMRPGPRLKYALDEITTQLEAMGYNLAQPAEGDLG